jgi:uncharacterized Zn finger protein
MKPAVIKCINCKDVMHDVCESESTGEYICWCDMCGTVLAANKNDPIGTDDYAVPHVTKEIDLPVRRLPVFRTWK